MTLLHDSLILSYDSFINTWFVHTGLKFSCDSLTQFLNIHMWFVWMNYLSPHGILWQLFPYFLFPHVIPSHDSFITSWDSFTRSFYFHVILSTRFFYFHMRFFSHDSFFFPFHTIHSHDKCIFLWLFHMIHLFTCDCWRWFTKLFYFKILLHDSFIKTWDSFTRFFYFHMILLHIFLISACDTFAWVISVHVILSHAILLFPFAILLYDSFISIRDSFTWLFYVHVICQLSSFTSVWIFFFFKIHLFPYDSFPWFTYFHAILSHDPFNNTWVFNHMIFSVPRDSFTRFISFPICWFFFFCSSTWFTYFPQTSFVRESCICSRTTIGAAVIEKNKSTFCPRRSSNPAARWHKLI